jgi:hypothetical protein
MTFMKYRTTILAFLAACLLYLGSYSNGPTLSAGDATGSPLTQTQCSNCHNGGSFAPSATLEVLDEGVAVTEYMPGKTYTISIAVTAQNNPAGYGYQAVVLDQANNQAGSFGTPGADFRIVNFGPRQYFEHRRRQASSTAEIEWQAPPAGTSEVTIYAATNSVNNNGSTGGDNVAFVELSLSEAQSSNVDQLVDSKLFEVASLGGGQIRLVAGEAVQSPISIQVYDLNGRMLIRQSGLSRNDLVQVAAIPQPVLVNLHDAAGSRFSQKLMLY